MTKKKCKAEVELSDATKLSCELPEDHKGPVHRDGDYEWGDSNLPAPTPED